VFYTVVFHTWLTLRTVIFRALAITLELSPSSFFFINHFTFFFVNFTFPRLRSLLGNIFGTTHVPTENEKDALALPQEIKNRVDIKLVSRVEGVLNEVLLDYKIEEEHGDEHSAEKRDVASYLLVEDLERALRECIRTRLEKISENWWKERIPPDVREKAEEKKIETL
jgi:hypothetical protein